MENELFDELLNWGPTFLRQLENLQTGIVIGVVLVVLFVMTGLCREIRNAQ